MHQSVHVRSLTVMLCVLGLAMPLPPEPLGSQRLPSLGLKSFNGGPKGKL
jgi:hypothetical protein